MSERHKCPAPTCTEQVPHHVLMCRRHWYEVPKPIRDKVNRTWRAYQSGTGPSGSFWDYCEAREEAILAVTP